MRQSFSRSNSCFRIAMRLVTFCTNDSPALRLGARKGRQIVDLGPGRMKELLAGGPVALERTRKATGPVLEERAVRYLPPVPDADKFLCVGKNYRQHLEELRANELLAEMPQEPTAFVKLNSCLVGHEARMRVNTRDQIWKFPDILEHFSRYIPFEPGDMFSTGAPGGVAVGKPNAAELFLKPGDIVECSIEGITTLRTHIV